MSQVTRGVTEPQDARQLRRRLRLGEVLVSEGLTSEAEIHVALSQQKKQKGKRLGEVLVELGMLRRVPSPESWLTDWGCHSLI